MHDWQLAPGELKVAEEIERYIEQALRGAELCVRLQSGKPEIDEQLSYELVRDGIRIERHRLNQHIRDYLLRVAVIQHYGWGAGVPRALVEAGANPRLRVHSDSGDPRKSYPILGRLAAFPDCTNAINAFIAAGADVNERDDGYGTPLHFVFADPSAYTDGVAALIAAGADIEARNDRGCTPLHYASQTVHRGLPALLDAGANVGARDRVGRTPLHWAAGHSTGWTIEHLVKAGADLDARDDSGRTPLHLAAANRILERVEALVEAGANIHAVDGEGQEPGDVADGVGIQAYLRRQVVLKSMGENGESDSMGPSI